MIASDIIIGNAFHIEHQEEKHIQPHEKIQNYIKNTDMIKVLQKKGVKYFFPIQYSTYGIIYNREDLIGKDRTGSGKTIAYSLPLIQKFRSQNLFKNQYIKLLIVLPTRQLCIQVTNEIESLKLYPEEFNILSIYGGTQKFKQINKLKDKVDIISATPGRLLDLLQSKKIDFSGIEAVCLDQADQMLKMGFQQDVENIYKYINKIAYNKPQNLLFSATVPHWVEKIAIKFMSKNLKFIDLIKDQQIKTSKTVTHLSLCMKYKDILPKIKDIVNVYCGNFGRCIIFCQRKDQVNQILHNGQLKIQSQALHSDVPQNQREITFKNFKQGKLKCLISTNVAARGLDIPNVDLVIQLEPPKNVQDYIHRSGRTGRAGKKGVCLTIYLKSQQYLLKNIQKIAKIQFKDIGLPQPDDYLTRFTIDVIQKLKSIDSAPLDYFEQLADQLIYEIGSRQAVKRVLSFATKVTTRIPCQSLINKEKNKISYKIKYKGSKSHQQMLSNQQISAFLNKHLILDEKKIKQIISSIQKVTDVCVALNVPQIYLKKMKELQRQTHDGYQVSRVTLMSQLTNQQLFIEQLPQYTQEQYDNAIYYNYQLYIGKLPEQTEAYELQKLFHKKGIRFINLSVNSKNGKGFAFLKCLTQEDLKKAVQMDGLLLFQGQKLELRIASEKSQKHKNKDKKEKKEKKQHKHSKQQY